MSPKRPRSGKGLRSVYRVMIHLYTKTFTKTYLRLIHPALAILVFGFHEIASIFFKPGNSKSTPKTPCRLALALCLWFVSDYCQKSRIIPSRDRTGRLCTRTVTKFSSFLIDTTVTLVIYCGICWTDRNLLSEQRYPGQEYTNYRLQLFDRRSHRVFFRTLPHSETPRGSRVSAWYNAGTCTEEISFGIIITCTNWIVLSNLSITFVSRPYL